RTFWRELQKGEVIRQTLPNGARSALEATLPKPTPQFQIRRRTAGLGSLGRRRFVATALVGGAPVAREAKARVPPASVWAHMPEASPEKIAQRAVRVPDPYFDIHRQWTVRRLSPDCNKIDLGTLPRQEEQFVLLYSVGWETANVHLGSERRTLLLRHVRRRKADWLRKASERMTAAMQVDWRRWRREYR